MNTTSTASPKRDIQWFENRIGSFIFRAPIFEIEKNRPNIPMKIKDKNHARQLHDLQRPGRPAYYDKPEDVVK